MRTVLATILTVALMALSMFGIVYLPIACQAEPGMIEEQDEEETQSVCPLTKMTDQKSCRDCHEVRKEDNSFKWGIQDKTWRNLPYGATMVKRNGRDVLHHLLDDISDSKVFELYEYADKHGINHIELEVDSPGGSVVSAWRIVGIIQGYPKIHTTTRCNGFAASAGFTIFV